MDVVEEQITEEKKPEVVSDEPQNEREQLWGEYDKTRSSEEREEDESYLASAALFGNGLMLERMKANLGKRANQPDKPKFTVIKELLDKTVSSCNEKISKDNFDVKYTQVMIDYKSLVVACKQYEPELKGFFLTSKKKNQAMQHAADVKKILQIATLEMEILPRFSRVLAESESGLSVSEVFKNAGIELGKAPVEEPEEVKTDDGKPKTDEVKPVTTPPVKSESEDKLEPLTVESLQAQVNVLREQLNEVLSQLRKMSGSSVVVDKE